MKIKSHIPATLPKGTTIEQWQRYEADMIKHEKRVHDTRPNTADYSTAESYRAATQKWEIMRSCDEPNKPGYYRANND